MSSALLPQLDFSTYSSQIFWLFVTLSILYFSLSRVFLPNIANLMRKRDEYIGKIYENIEIDSNSVDELENDLSSMSKKNKNQIEEISRSTKEKIEKIGKDNQILIDKELKNMKNKLAANLSDIIDSDKDQYKKESEVIFKNFSDIFSLNQNETNNLNEIFEDNWKIQINETLSKYNIIKVKK